MFPGWTRGALALYFAPREDIITGEAMRPAVAENGRQRFDMLRSRAPCRWIFKGFHVPPQKLRDCRACRRRRRRAPTRAADKLAFAGVEFSLYGFKSLSFGFGKKAPDPLFSRPRITKSQNPLPPFVLDIS